MPTPRSGVRSPRRLYSSVIGTPTDTTSGRILNEERRLMVFDYLIRQGKEAPLLRQGGARGGWITWFDKAKRIRLPEAFIEPPRLPAPLLGQGGDLVPLPIARL